MDLTELEKHEEITSFSFDHDNAHMAITHQMQGGASTGHNISLIMKSSDIDEEILKALDQVTVTMSMEKFLSKFFHIWDEDAEVLTKLMGMETETEYRQRLEDAGEEVPDIWADDESFSEFRARQVDLAIELIEIIKASKDVAIQDMSTEQKVNLLKFQGEFEKSLTEYELEKATSESEKNLSSKQITKSEDESEEISSAIGSKTIKDEINKTEGEHITMPSKDKKVEVVVEKSAEMVEFEKAMNEKFEALEKAAKEKEESAKVELEKASAQLKVLEKAELARVEKAYGNFAESLSFIEKDAKEGLVEVLLKTRGVDGIEQLVEMLEKAQEAISAFGKEEGIEGEVPHDLDKASKVLDDKIAEKYADVKYL